MIKQKIYLKNYVSVQLIKFAIIETREGNYLKLMATFSTPRT